MVQQTPLTNGGCALVDDEDYALVMRYRWRRNSKGYAIHTFTEHGIQHELYMHRLVLDASKGQVVDHLDHNRLNNTKTNLRLCTQQENLRYRSRFRNNNCGFKGVTAWRGKWLARIYVYDRAVRLGRYDDLKSAALAYDYAARRLFREFALLNLPDQPVPLDIVQPVETRLREATCPGVHELLNRP